MATEWVDHADGIICGDIGLFPFFFKSWEIWRKRNGEWDRDEEFKPFKSLDEAKAVAEGLIAKTGTHQ